MNLNNFISKIDKFILSDWGTFTLIIIVISLISLTFYFNKKRDEEFSKKNETVR